MTTLSEPDVPHLARAAAMKRIESATAPGLGKALFTDVRLWELAATPLLGQNYRASYEAEKVDFYFRALKDTVCFYQQLHAVIADAVVLIGSTVDPPLDNIEGLQALERAAARHSNQSLRQGVQGAAREIRYLRWLAAVRNKAVQHRADNKHYGSDGIILSDGLVFARRRDQLSETLMQRIVRELDHLIDKYSLALDTADPLGYLDLVSLQLYGMNNADFDRSRDLVEEARLYQVVMSPALIKNVDACLAALIELVPARR